MYGTYYILPWVTLLSSSLSFARGVGAVPLSKYIIVFIRTSANSSDQRASLRV